MAGNDGTSSDGDTPWSEQDRAAVCDRVRSAAQLPGVEIEESHGHLGFAVRAKRFAWLLVDHHGDGRLALTLKAPPGEQNALVGTRRGYFIPSYLGTRGWIGIDLAPSARPDWDDIPELIEQAWRMNASKRVIAAWDRTQRPDEASP